MRCEWGLIGQICLMGCDGVDGLDGANGVDGLGGANGVDGVNGVNGKLKGGWGCCHLFFHAARRSATMKLLPPTKMRSFSLALPRAACVASATVG